MVRLTCQKKKMESYDCELQVEELPLEEERYLNGRHRAQQSQGSAHEGLEHGGVGNHLLDDAAGVQHALEPRELELEEEQVHRQEPLTPS